VEQLRRVTPAVLAVLAVVVSARDDLHGFAIAHEAGRLAVFIRSLTG
jgi:hypothetical protein